MNGGHNHVILEEFEGNYLSVGFTTKVKKGNNSTNKKLDFDPFGKGADSYMRRQGTVDKIKNYSRRTRKGQMSKRNYSTALEYGRRAKNKFLQKNKK